MPGGLEGLSSSVQCCRKERDWAWWQWCKAPTIPSSISVLFVFLNVWFSVWPSRHQAQSNNWIFSVAKAQNQSKQIAPQESVSQYGVCRPNVNQSLVVGFCWFLSYTPWWSKQHQAKANFQSKHIAIYHTAPKYSASVTPSDILTCHHCIHWSITLF